MKNKWSAWILMFALAAWGLTATWAQQPASGEAKTAGACSKHADGADKKDAAHHPDATSCCNAKDHKAMACRSSQQAKTDCCKDSKADCSKDGKECCGGKDAKSCQTKEGQGCCGEGAECAAKPAAK